MTTRKRVLIINAYSKHSTYAQPRKHVKGLIMLLAVLTLTCLLAPHLALAQEFNYVEPEQLLRQIEAKADIVLLDAQPAKKYTEAHIRGAVNVAGMAQIEELDLPYSRPLVIYCDCAGEEASRFLAARLIKSGYKQENIFILKGGWYKWLELGYPVVKGNQPQSSNESQGQVWQTSKPGEECRDKEPSLLATKAQGRNQVEGERGDIVCDKLVRGTDAQRSEGVDHARY